MPVVLAIILFAHGIAHLPGFFVSWQLPTPEEHSFKTTILSGHLNVGDAGIRVVGILCVVAAIVFMTASIGTGMRLPWWQPVTSVASVYSFILCLFCWPDARIGFFVDVALIGFLLANRQWGWLP